MHSQKNPSKKKIREGISESLEQLLKEYQEDFLMEKFLTESIDYNFYSNSCNAS